MRSFWKNVKAETLAEIDVTNTFPIGPCDDEELQQCASNMADIAARRGEYTQEKREEYQNTWYQGMRKRTPRK
jgi:hypothetical protein